MTTTDETTTTEVPDWLNLDVVVSAELREWFAMLAEHLEAQLMPGGDLRLSLEALVELSDAFNDETRVASLPDDTYEVVSRASGFSRLTECAGEIHGILKGVV
jgi:hypothetical protein